MAIKELQTRIALKYDSYENWTKDQSEESIVGKNLVLLAGEIGICEIPSNFTANGDSRVMPTVLFKVGNGTSKFHELPWASAKAADVYSWAKSETVVLIEVEEGSGDAKVKKQYLQFKTGDTVNRSVDLSSFATDAELKATTDRVKALEDALGLDGTGEDSVANQILGINGRLDSIIGTEDKTGLIAEAETRIEAKLGKGFDAENTVADAIEAAQSAAKDYADDAIEALSEDGGAIFALDARVDALEDRVDLGSGETVKGVITAAIEAIDSVNTGDVTDGAASANTVVKSVSQTNGVVTVTYGKLTRDELPELIEDDIPEIHANKVVVADATTDGEGKPVAKVTLDAKLTSIDGKLNSITDSIAGGVHFIGTIAADATLPDSADPGDVIIKGTQEYIYNGTTWEPLGDVTRIGAVEEQIAAMDADFDADTNKFVTGIVQVDGKITQIDTARPTAEHVQYGTKSVEGTETVVTVKAKIDELAGKIDAVEDRADELELKVDLAEGETVTGVINDVLEGLNLTDEQATGEGDFVVSVTQTNGQIAVEKGKLPEATASDKGIVTLGASGGAATFDVVDALSQKVDTLENTTIPGITDRVDTLEDDYVRIGSDNKMYKGKEGADYIVFNCGSATELI